MPRISQQDFVERAVARHGDRYDYSLSVYAGQHTNVTIRCADHGLFEMMPANHWRGANCPECSGVKRYTGADLIERGRLVHGDVYDYSLIDPAAKVVVTEKVPIICPEHGVFMRTPRSHMAGLGCPMSTKRVRLDAGLFAERARAVHGDRYDYSKVVYRTVDDRVEVICAVHGSFFPTPWNHLKGHACNGCASIQRAAFKRLSTEQFVERAMSVHGDRYDYSLVDYQAAKIPVRIICVDHGEFEQAPTNHLVGAGCVRCAPNTPYTTESWTAAAVDVHGDKFDYSRVVYSPRGDVEIGCPKHGWVTANLAWHLRSPGCPQCSSELRGLKLRLDGAEVIARMAAAHPCGGYDYSRVVYVHSAERVEILCQKHGPFMQLPGNHINGAGCPRCSWSRGERTLAGIFDGAGIRFETQKSFDGLVGTGGGRLLFDFYLPDAGVLVEYDGEQHFRPVDIFGGVDGFERVQEHDRAKDAWAAGSGFRLVRVRFDEDPLAVLVAAAVVDAAD